MERPHKSCSKGVCVYFSSEQVRLIEGAKRRTCCADLRCLLFKREHARPVYAKSIAITGNHLLFARESPRLDELPAVEATIEAIQNKEFPRQRKEVTRDWET